MLRRMRGDRVPHIGEYAAKTNAIWAVSATAVALAITPEIGPPRRLKADAKRPIARGS